MLSFHVLKHVENIFGIYVVHIQSVKGEQFAWCILIVQQTIQARSSFVPPFKCSEFHTHAKHETKFGKCLYNSCHKMDCP